MKTFKADYPQAVGGRLDHILEQKESSVRARDPFEKLKQFRETGKMRRETRNRPWSAFPAG